MTFADFERVLFARANFGMKLGLARMEAALAALGAPHRAAPVLHVAGSNGKGSTCAFAEASLRAAGLRTGLYTSPHLLHFCERIRLDGEPVGEEVAVELFEEVLRRVPWALSGGPEGAHDGDGLTFFELATAMAFLAFARAGVQVMVIEVGLGGRLDATNVVSPLACAVAPLSLEHTQYLGATLAAIAGEKAGIFKPGVPAVSAGQPREAAQVLQGVADACGAALWRPGRDYRYESRSDRGFCYQGPRWTVRPERLSLLGHHQRGNAALACALLEAAAGRGLPVLPQHAQQGLSCASWPGRLMQVASGPDVFLDGAHNPHAARALAHALPELLGGRPLWLLFGALADKEVGPMLSALLRLAAGAIFCSPSSPRALPSAELLASARLLAPRLPLQEAASPALALEQARAAAGPQGAVLGCGSLYLVGELWAAAQGRGALRPMPGERFAAEAQAGKLFAVRPRQP